MWTGWVHLVYGCCDFPVRGRISDRVNARSGKLVWLAVLGIALAGWLTAADAKPRPLTIFFSGFVEGTFGPCGCKAGPNGGLARRAGYSAEEAKRTDAVVLQVDLGHYFHPLGPQSRAINEFMRAGLRQLPIRVLNLAAGDLFLWEELSDADLGPTQVISTNLVPRDASAAKPKPYAIVEISAAELGTRRDLRIGFLGVSDPARVKPNSGFKGDDPVAAVAKVSRELASRTDFQILLADLPRELGPLAKDSVLHRIASQNPSIYAILTTEKRYVFHPPEQVGNAVILSSVERGRHLGQLTLTLGADGTVEAVQPQLIDLKEGVPEDPALHAAQLELEGRLR